MVTDAVAIYSVPSKLHLGQDDLLIQAADWFGKDAANGDVCVDTVKTYIYKLRSFLEWCAESGLHPFAATPDDIKSYRKLLVKGGLLPSGKPLVEQSRASIQSKLSIIRSFYNSAVSRGLVSQNPAHKILPPRNRSAIRPVKHFAPHEVDLLKQVLPTGANARELRDLSIILLCMVEGIRRVSISRANVEDIELTEKGVQILVHGKGKEYFIYPSQITSQVLKKYIEASGLSSIHPDGETPLFMSFFKGGEGGRAGCRKSRITRNGVSDVVNRYLCMAGIKTAGRSVHALRHTCGFYVYQKTKDVKMVQQVLGHSALATAAIYSHTEDLAEARITGQIDAFKQIFTAVS